MSAERLRQAATILRDPIRCNRPVYEDALADALDHAADHFWDYNAPHLEAVARLIVGGDA